MTEAILISAIKQVIFINDKCQKLSSPLEKESCEIGESQDKLFIRDLLQIRRWKSHISNPPTITTTSLYKEAWTDHLPIRKMQSAKQNGHRHPGDAQVVNSKSMRLSKRLS